MRSVIGSLLAFTFALAGTGLAIDVITCGQLVPDGEVGVLQEDLSCGGAFVGVMLGHNATLEMNGHRITGPGIRNGVECRGGHCTVHGPGEISGATGGQYAAGVGGTARRVVLTRLDIHHNAVGVYHGGLARVIATDVVAHDNQLSGIDGVGVRATNVTVTGNGGAGIGAGRRLRGTNITADGNGSAGLFGSRISVENVRARNNGDCGVRALAVRIVDGEVTGNDGLNVGGDVCAARRPRLLEVTCGKSVVLGAVSGSTWGVCTDD